LLTRRCCTEECRRNKNIGGGQVLEAGDLHQEKMGAQTLEAHNKASFVAANQIVGFFE